MYNTHSYKTYYYISLKFKPSAKYCLSSQEFEMHIL